MNIFYDKEKDKIKGKNIISSIVILVVFLIIIFGGMGTVGAGERGVKLRFNGITGKVFGEGLYFKLPIVEKVIKFDIKTQKDQTNADAASKDLQTVTSIVAINFHINAEKVAQLYQTVGKEYKERIIDPIIQESVKASTAKYTAEELITKREQVRDDVKLLLKEKLEKVGIVVDEFNIVNFDFSPTFNAAIEAKVTAEQQALAAKNKLEQVKFEAQQAIESAQGKAKAIQIEGDALRSTPQIVELRYIERWDGKMPTYWGGANMFVGLPEK